MSAQWVVLIAAAIQALGVVGQWMVGSRAAAKRDGMFEERLSSHGARLQKHGEEIDGLREVTSQQSAKLAGFAERLNAHHTRG